MVTWFINNDNSTFSSILQGVPKTLQCLLVNSSPSYQKYYTFIITILYYGRGYPQGQSLRLKCTPQGQSLRLKCTPQGQSLWLKCTPQGLPPKCSLIQIRHIEYPEVRLGQDTFGREAQGEFFFFFAQRCLGLAD